MSQGNKAKSFILRGAGTAGVAVEAAIRELVPGLGGAALGASVRNVICDFANRRLSSREKTRVEYIVDLAIKKSNHASNLETSQEAMDSLTKKQMEKQMQKRSLREFY